MFLFCHFIVQPWFYPVVKYCFDAICFTRFIFVNSVIVSSYISCNDLSWDIIVMYVWCFVSWNSLSASGAILPSLSPCTVVNLILPTYLLMWVIIKQFHVFSALPFKIPIDYGVTMGQTIITGFPKPDFSDFPLKITKKLCWWGSLYLSWYMLKLYNTYVMVTGMSHTYCVTLENYQILTIYIQCSTAITRSIFTQIPTNDAT